MMQGACAQSSLESVDGRKVESNNQTMMTNMVKVRKKSEKMMASIEASSRNVSSLRPNNRGVGGSLSSRSNTTTSSISKSGSGLTMA